MLSRLKHNLVYVTPAPIFIGLEGLDNRMAGRMKMFGRVLVFRGIAAANMPANQTFAQVYPGIPNFQAILAAIRTGRDFPDLVKMRTILCHLFCPFFEKIVCQRVTLIIVRYGLTKNIIHLASCNLEKWVGCCCE